MRKSTMTRKRFVIPSAFFTLMLLLALTGLEACSASDALSPEPETNEETKLRDVTLNFSFAIDEEVSTRAGRELWSRDPKQQVNAMKMLAFKGEGKDATYCGIMDVTEFSNTSPKDTQTEQVELTMTLTAGTYIFLAIGFENNAGDPQRCYTLPALTEGETSLKDITLSLAEGIERADEVFAGIKEGITIGESSTIVEGGELILNRVVAGVLGYFKNIPYYVVNPENGDELLQVARLKLIASAHGEEVSVLAPFNSVASSNEEVEILSFDLKGFQRDGSNNWYDIPAYDWSAEGRSGVPQGVQKVKNSVLGGRFLLPFTRVAGKPTLRVVLYDEEENELKSYGVVCSDQADGIDPADKKIFDIKGNHYYCLGVKYTDDGHKPDDPEEPFTPDDPIDLSKEQVITIKVNPKWDIRHDLTL